MATQILPGAIADAAGAGPRKPATAAAAHRPLTRCLRTTLETELKFQVPPGHRETLRRAVATASARTTRLQAVYADTPEQRLAAAGLALRLRKEGSTWVQTLKGRGDGLMQRLEHEVPLPAQAGEPVLDPQRHAGTPAGAALLATLAGGAVLRPVYRTDIQRLHRRVRHQGALIEIAYDRGRIVAGERRIAVDEIEFELIRGPATALLDLAARWALRHGLWWDVRTKSERGYRLALGMDQVPAVKADAFVLPADAGTGAAWSAVLQSALAQALPNAAEIAAGSATPEHLHQLRVALRRLRTVLRVFAPWSSDAAVANALEAEWKAPFASLGAARDRDVLAQALQPALAAAGAPAVAWPEDAAAPQPADVVRSPAFTVLLLRTLALATEPRSPATGSLAAAARELMAPLLRRARRDASAFAQATVEQQHRTRKRLKRLRYALEFMAPLLQAKPTRRLHARLCAALQALGELNDLHAAETQFRARVEAQPQAWFGVGYAAARSEAALKPAARRLLPLRRARLEWRDG